jgi:hypothetical protein
MKKKIVIVLIYFFISKLSIGQECEINLDPFTNEPILTFDYSPYGVKYLQFESNSSQKTIEIRFVENGSLVTSIPKGSNLFIKFQNGDTIQLKTLAETTSKSDYSGPRLKVVYTEYYLKSEISILQLQKLANSPVTYLRFPNLQGGYTDYSSGDMGKAFRKSFMEGAECILYKK